MLALMAGVWVIALIVEAPAVPALPSLGLFSSLAIVIWFDFDRYRIPNWVSYPLIASGLALTAFWPDPPFVHRLAGMTIGYGLIWGLRVYWQRTRGVDGIGMGDAKLLAAAGAWLGVLALPFVTLIASISALVWVATTAWLSSTQIDRTQRLPFGPFIALGFWSIWLLGGLVR